MRNFLAVQTEGGGGGSGGGSVTDPRVREIIGEVKPPSGLEEFSTDPGGSLSTLLSVGIKFFFIVAGLIAFLYLLRGSLDWIMSSGEKEKVSAAQQRIQNAIIGLVMIVAVVGLIATLEKFVFNGAFCFGLTCPIKLPAFQ